MREQEQNRGGQRPQDQAGGQKQAGERDENNRQGNPGNFANDRERASDAGRKGGRQSH